MVMTLFQYFLRPHEILVKVRGIKQILKIFGEVKLL